VEHAKTCSRCKQRKPITEFSIASRRPDGRDLYCKACRKSIKEARMDDAELWSELDELQRQRETPIVLPDGWKSWPLAQKRKLRDALKAERDRRRADGA
jgi:hypothetical protein